MATSTKLLHRLLRDLKGWFQYILKATYSKDISYEVHSGGEFTLKVVWKTGEFSKRYTRSDVLGDKSDGELQHCIGYYARQFIRDVLAARGVL